MASKIVYNHKYSFYVEENVYAFGIRYIFEKFTFQIRHLQNIIGQGLQGQILTKKPLAEESVC